MKTARLILEIMGHCIYQSIRHPKSMITQIANPRPIIQSPIPWWGSLGVLLMGIGAWVGGDVLGILGLCEAARAMVYIPLGNIFGMSLNIAGQMQNLKK